MSASQETYELRDLRTFSEAIEVRRIQQSIWGFDDPAIGLYPPLLLVAAQNGGTVLCAFDAHNRMIGYVFGILGREPGGPLKICSISMGVLPEWRGRGVGKALKMVQRDRALAAGLSLITWTFDPLESRNAHLNLHMLGATSRRYIRNIYGEHFGALNEGLPTDRLLAEWWITDCAPAAASGPVDEAASLEALDHAFEVTDGRVMELHANLNGQQVWIEIPDDVQALKQSDRALALDWRLRVREGFERYFERGYVAVDYRVVHEADRTRQGYVLTHAIRQERGVCAAAAPR